MTPLPRIVAIVRVMLGVEFVVNGLNWWVKLIGPYPSIGDFSSGHPPPPDFVGAMIATGFLFHIVKAIEISAGVALLADRFVPLALVAALPVTINVFFVDVLMQHHLRGFVMGTGALTMSVFLMLACLPHYEPLLAARMQRAGPVAGPAWLRVADAQPFVGALVALGLVAAAFGAVMLGWVGLMIVQHFTS